MSVFFSPTSVGLTFQVENHFGQNNLRTPFSSSFQDWLSKVDVLLTLEPLYDTCFFLFLQEYIGFSFFSGVLKFMIIYIPYYVSGLTNYARYLINFSLETHRFQCWEMSLSFALLVSSPSFGLLSPSVAQWSDGRPLRLVFSSYLSSFLPSLCLLAVFSGIVFHLFFLTLLLR